MSSQTRFFFSTFLLCHCLATAPGVSHRNTIHQKKRDFSCSIVIPQSAPLFQKISVHISLARYSSHAPYNQAKLWFKMKKEKKENCSGWIHHGEWRKCLAPGSTDKGRSKLLGVCEPRKVGVGGKQIWVIVCSSGQVPGIQ